MLSLGEIITVVIVLTAIYFLGKKAPPIARSLGNGISYLKTLFFRMPKEVEDEVNKIKKELKEDE